MEEEDQEDGGGFGEGGGGGGGRTDVYLGREGEEEGMSVSPPNPLSFSLAVRLSWEGRIDLTSTLSSSLFLSRPHPTATQLSPPTGHSSILAHLDAINSSSQQRSLQPRPTAPPPRIQTSSSSTLAKHPPTPHSTRTAPTSAPFSHVRSGLLLLSLFLVGRREQSSSFVGRRVQQQFSSIHSSVLVRSSSFRGLASDQLRQLDGTQQSTVLRPRNAVLPFLATSAATVFRS